MGSLCECADALASAFLLFILEVLTIAKLDHQLNEEIRDKEIRLIGADGAQLGIVSAAQANAMAEEQGMDLVKISPNATPPVCKIMDYSKFCYDQKKREKDAKKNQKVVEIKEIRMSPSIDTNDFNTKVKAAQKFLADGNRVKVRNIAMKRPSSLGFFSMLAISVQAAAKSISSFSPRLVCAISRPRKRTETLTRLPSVRNF